MYEDLLPDTHQYMKTCCQAPTLLSSSNTNFLQDNIQLSMNHMNLLNILA